MQARNLAQNLKDVGGNLSEGLSELQEGAVCTSARTGVYLFAWPSGHPVWS